MSVNKTENETSNRTLIVLGSRWVAEEAMITQYIDDDGRSIVAQAIVSACPFDRTDVDRVLTGGYMSDFQWGGVWGSHLDSVDVDIVDNQDQMIEEADSLLVFYCGEFEDTKELLGSAFENQLDVTVINVNKEKHLRIVLDEPNLIVPGSEEEKRMVASFE